MNNLLLTVFLSIACFSLFGQSVQLKGYVIDGEQEHRLDDAQINVYHNDFLLSNFIETDRNGAFDIQLPEGGSYRLEIIRPAYERKNVIIETDGKQVLEIAIPMFRLQGYEFIGTVKKLLVRQDALGEEIKDIKVEVYNQTTGVEELNLPLHPKASFNFNFERGNRYTMMIRKKGFFAKRFDVLVNIDGCLLCFEGLGLEYQPNILEEITQGNSKGVLAADIPFRLIAIDEAVRLDNIYYDYNKANIRPDARPALNKLVQIMRATPIIIELGSHTDSRGKDEYNMQLSQKRAQSAVDYIVSRGIDQSRISARGYGESQLLNNCDDGAKCNEKEHQLNRRTTFKVTKLMTASSFDNKTLKEIIELERISKKRVGEEMKFD